MSTCFLSLSVGVPRAERASATSSRSGRSSHSHTAHPQAPRNRRRRPLGAGLRPGLSQHEYQRQLKGATTATHRRSPSLSPELRHELRELERAKLFEFPDS
ncbi:hypothetical protein B0H21DRAFT_826776 [Amylocystis lapponica]|nr:hypothetical protein B0H21DRAFT_826776 [Amylocystis lapponica]